jgi:hypothetical protein
VAAGYLQWATWKDYYDVDRTCAVSPAGLNANHLESLLGQRAKYLLSMLVPFGFEGK